MENGIRKKHLEENLEAITSAECDGAGVSWGPSGGPQYTAVSRAALAASLLPGTIQVVGYYC